jgi:predicted acyltransferase (DUF342 family)
LKKLKIDNKILSISFATLVFFIMSATAFSPAKAMHIIKTECTEQNKAIVTYFFGSDEKENKYTDQIIDGNLIIEVGASVAECAFASTVIKGDVIIKESARLNRWAFRSAKIEGNVILEADVGVGFQVFVFGIIDGNVIIHNIHSNSPAFEKTLIKGNVVIKQDTHICRRPLFSYGIIEGNVIVEKGAQIYPRTFEYTEINHLIDDR